MIKELNHVGIRTADMEASIRFYQGALGGRIIRDAKSLDGKARFVYIQIGVGVLELISVGPNDEQGFAHIAFLTGKMSLDEAYAKLNGEGLKFTVLPKTAGSGDGRLAFFYDLSGVVFELIERKENIRKPAFSTELVEAFDHIAVETNAGLNAVGKFYTEEMGFVSAGKQNRYVNGGDVIELSKGGKGIANISLKVKDCEAVQKKLQSLYPLSEIKKAPEGGREFSVKAPSGETVRFFE
jgi:catechol 2,3-dioxygenase-like lactoylglutathione lyase family enzyme